MRSNILAPPLISVDSWMVNENREESGRNIFFRQNAKIFLSFQWFFRAGIGQCKNHIHTLTLHPNIFQIFLRDTRITCRENHNHRPCRWFAQAPLGPFTSRAYRLTTEFLLHGVPCCYSNSGRVLLYSISNISLLSSPSFFTVSSLRSDIFSGHS